MALSEDQRAMLRLLAQREQGYEDIAALMGISVEQVRAKVSGALAEIEAEEAAPAGDVEPANGAAEASEPEPPAPVSKSAGERPTPSQRPPEVEPVTAPKTGPAAKPASPRSAPLSAVGSRFQRPSGRRAWIEWLGGAAIVVLIVLFATGTLNIGGGGSSSTTTSETPAETTNSAAAKSSQTTKAVLTPVNGGKSAGLALFGRIKKTAVLQVEAKGLEPSPKGKSYTVWLYRSPKLVLRIGAVAVGKSGTIAAQFPLPTQLLAYVASGAFNQIDISLTPNSSYEAEVARAKKEKRLPPYTGVDTLRGKITGPGVK